MRVLRYLGAPVEVPRIAYWLGAVVCIVSTIRMLGGAL